jgi:hypothetical protein
MKNIKRLSTGGSISESCWVTSRYSIRITKIRFKNIENPSLLIKIRYLFIYSLMTLDKYQVDKFICSLHERQASWAMRVEIQQPKNFRNEPTLNSILINLHPINSHTGKPLVSLLHWWNDKQNKWMDGIFRITW